MRTLLSFLILLNISCNPSNLKVVGDLSSELNEVSGITTISNSDLIWMVNDSGNKPRIYGVSEDGKIRKELKIKAKNNDWEDLTSDPDGNIYIGDFGNNYSKRENLAILKVSKDSLNESGKINIERISFSYENQTKFPPKKKGLYFDCEAFFYHKNNLYLFTKSRVKHDFGKTSLYKIPAKKGTHIAQLIAEFNTCEDMSCWITSADISDDGETVVLLTPNSIWSFTDFEADNFFSGVAIKHDLGFDSQKESVCFKDKQTLYIADEKAHGEGGNLYQLNFN